ncbi:MAG: hypothetical protein ACD_28C00080G0001 [uncultured bacterium]|nr:MAG: hypothetical protein ACD_28C00080G0001 [uncultured bacterium]
MAPQKRYEFIAVIKSAGKESGGAYVEFPFDTVKEFGKRGRVKVLCFFEKIQYRGSLVKMGTDCHIIGVSRKIREELGKKIGEKIQVELVEDVEERIVEIPEDLARKLQKETLMNEFRKLSFTRQKEFARMVEEARTQETIDKRILKIVDELSKIRAGHSSHGIKGSDLKKKAVNG